MQSSMLTAVLSFTLLVIATCRVTSRPDELERPELVIPKLKRNVANGANQGLGLPSGRGTSRDTPGAP